MLALHHTPVELVRQVRLELTIPCLRGRCLDPIWLLTHGGTERTRTVIDLIDNQVPHLSATVPKIADFQSARLEQSGSSRIEPIGIENQESKMMWVGRGDSTPHGPQSQCGALPIELRPT